MNSCYNKFNRHRRIPFIKYYFLYDNMGIDL